MPPRPPLESDSSGEAQRQKLSQRALDSVPECAATGGTVRPISSVVSYLRKDLDTSRNCHVDRDLDTSLNCPNTYTSEPHRHPRCYSRTSEEAFTISDEQDPGKSLNCPYNRDHGKSRSRSLHSVHHPVAWVVDDENSVRSDVCYSLGIDVPVKERVADLQNRGLCDILLQRIEKEKPTLLWIKLFNTGTGRGNRQDCKAMTAVAQLMLAQMGTGNTLLVDSDAKNHAWDHRTIRQVVEDPRIHERRIRLCNLAHMGARPSVRKHRVACTIDIGKHLERCQCGLRYEDHDRHVEYSAEERLKRKREVARAILRLVESSIERCVGDSTRVNNITSSTETSLEPPKDTAAQPRAVHPRRVRFQPVHHDESAEKGTSGGLHGGLTRRVSAD